MKETTIKKLDLIELSIEDNKMESIEKEVNRYLKNRQNELFEKAIHGTQEDMVKYNLFISNKGRLRIKLEQDFYNIIKIMDKNEVLDK